VIVELTGLKNMKHITITFMLIVGFQFSVCAETLFFEHFYNNVSIYSVTPQKTSYAAMEERFNKLDSELDLEKKLGTIRLKAGEKLTLGQIKFLKQKTDLNVYNPDNIDVGSYSISDRRYASFELQLNYDLFKQPQKITILNKVNKQWEVNFSDDIFNGTGVKWPIEGPVTISIKCKPLLTKLINYNQKIGQYRYSLADLDEQYISISFEKSISSINNNQSKQQVLVLPKDSKNTNVIMESSEDLVNWTTDSPGPKNTADSHRFFRLRAVKE
jgi:hypothetical protein